jgi:hypothetical protein
LALRLRRKRQAVSSYDVAALRRATWRARVLRWGLAAAAVVLLGAAAESARGLDVRERSFLPPGSTGVIVLDLSLSIAERNYIDVRRAVRKLVATDAPVGLVIFSDSPYELLPPGTPASEMEPLLRLLEPSRSGPPINPWWQTFRAGTRISSALELARDMLVRDHVKDGFIVLVSDLETAPEDVETTTNTLQELRGDSIDVRIVPIAPSSDGLRVFGQVLGQKAFADLPQNEGKRRLFESTVAGRLPKAVLVLAALVFLSLAAHERFAGRLALPRLGRRKAS